MADYHTDLFEHKRNLHVKVRLRLLQAGGRLLSLKQVTEGPALKIPRKRTW